MRIINAVGQSARSAVSTLSNNAYSITSWGAASTIALLSGVLYFVTTKDAKPYERASGIGANVIQNLYIAKDSIDFIVDLLRKKACKAFAQAAFIALVAAGCYIPQIIISWNESNSTQAFRIFAAASTFLAGSTLYAYAMAQLYMLFGQAKNTLTEKVPFYFRKLFGFATEAEINVHDEKARVLTNVDIILARLPFAKYQHPDFAFDPSDNLQTAITLAHSAPTPRFMPLTGCPAYLATTLRLILGTAASAAMLYGSLGYTFSTESSLRNDFSASKVAAMLGANALMFLQYALNSIAGFSLVNSLLSIATNAIQYGTLFSNDLSLGGNLGKAAIVASILASLVAASFSGFTSKMLFEKYSNASLMSGLKFAGAAVSVDYSARVFNFIYDVKSFFSYYVTAIKTLGNSESIQNDRSYLALKKAVADMRSQIANTPADKLDDVLTASGQQLKTAGLFRQRSEQCGMHTTLLSGTDPDLYGTDVARTASAMA